MCYSARIEADWRKFVKEFGARIGLREFAELLLGARELEQSEDSEGDGCGVLRSAGR